MNKNICFSALLITLVSFNFTTAQIRFNTIPINKQLIPRNLSDNLGTIKIIGSASTVGTVDLVYESWNAGEPNNNPSPEDVVEIINISGKWNDDNRAKKQASYVEYDGLINSLSNFTYLGQYNGHSYFKNSQSLSWDEAKTAAENAGGYLSSHQTLDENLAVASFNYFRGWIGLFQDTNSVNYSEPNSGWRWVSGGDESYDEIDNLKVEFFKNEILTETLIENLVYENNSSSFEFNISANSELSKYGIKIYSSVNNDENLIRSIEDIVIGDVFVIQGQSNAAALAYNGSSNTYRSDFIRVFSGGHRSSGGVLSDSEWHYGQGDGNEDSKGNTGQWGLVLAKKLVDQLEIPIAIINGADGGKPVSFFQAPSDYKSSTNSNYGRLYYRLNKMGLKDAVRAVLWSQGEADSFQNGLTTNAYKISFNSLKNSWLTDYQNIEKIYIFQTRDCDCGTVLSGRLKIKEAQRQLADEYENIYIMGTSGIKVHSDNCHFPFSSGYESFGQRIFKPLMSHIYGYSYEQEINPPHIVSASLIDKQTLKIETNQNLFSNTNNTNNLLSKIRNDFVLADADGATVTSFNIENKSLILGLSANPGANPKISFNGKYSGVENNITNSVGLEMVCFSYFPITGGSGDTGGNVSDDKDKKPALVFVENGDGNPFNGQTYISTLRGASRNGNGNSNGAFGNIADWSVDMVVSEKSPEQAANDFGGFRDNQHPLYQGSDALTQNSTGLGALGWASFGANAYNRASGVGSAVFGFNNIAGRQDAESRGITGDDIGQGVFGYASRATGNVSFATGRRSTAAGSMSVSMGNFNYATGDSTIALGKENWAEGASTIAIGFKNHAAGGGSVALGQENIAWGTTNFTAGYQNTAGDINSDKGTGGSATAMGKYNTASADATMALNRGTTASNQAATSMGLGTTADNVAMLAIGVNNVAGGGDTTANQYYYADGQYTGAPAGIAFVIGNGDVNSSNGLAGDNSSNAFVVKYDGSATLAGDLALVSDARLKSNIISLGSTLAKLMQIDGKSYTMKSNERESKIGLLAQDVAKVLPELVKMSDDSDGTLSVNYQGLIPVLINAIKEQQKEIKAIRNRINGKG